MTQRHVYLATLKNGLCKIGISRHPKKRVTQISQTQPHKAALIHSWVVKDAGAVEKLIHQTMQPLKVR